MHVERYPITFNKPGLGEASIVKDAILPIYNDSRDKEQLSEETFFKRFGYFDKIKDKIEDMEILDGKNSRRNVSFIIEIKL